MRHCKVGEAEEWYANSTRSASFSSTTEVTTSVRAKSNWGDTEEGAGLRLIGTANGRGEEEEDTEEDEGERDEEVKCWRRGGKSTWPVRRRKRDLSRWDEESLHSSNGQWEEGEQKTSNRQKRRQKGEKRGIYTGK